MFSNGDEIVEPGAIRRGSQVFDSNRIMLIAMLRRIGCVVSDLGIRRDDSAEIARVLKHTAGSHDLILSSGGVSTGEGDYVKTAVESVGTLGVLAHRDEARAARGDGRHRRHAVHRPAG